MASRGEPRFYRFIGARPTVAQDRQKAANIIAWPNVGKADVEAEAPIRGLPTDSRLL